MVNRLHVHHHTHHPHWHNSYFNTRNNLYFKIFVPQGAGWQAIDDKGAAQTTQAKGTYTVSARAVLSQHTGPLHSLTQGQNVEDGEAEGRAQQEAVGGGGCCMVVYVCVCMFVYVYV